MKKLFFILPLLISAFSLADMNINGGGTGTVVISGVGTTPTLMTLQVTSNTILGSGSTFYQDGTAAMEGPLTLNNTTASQWLKSNASQQVVSTTLVGTIGASFGTSDFTSSGSTQCVQVLSSGTITGWSVVTDSGTINFNVKSDTYANYVTNNGVTSSVCASDCPRLTQVPANENLNANTWTTTVNANTVWCVDVDSVTVAPTRATVQVFYNRNQ